ncbi:MAG: alanine dehydrogenase [Desulfatiglandales bacterium]
MIVGIMKETRADENRVAMTPAGVEIMVQNGHAVLVEKAAGAASGFEDEAYIQMGADIVGRAGELLEQSELILRVREPYPFEFDLPRENQIYFAYLHLAASRKQCQAFIESGAICIAYETIQKVDGSLPLLKPMGEVAGPMAIQEGAKYLEMAHGGHGVLLGGVPGVDPGTVVILGGGIVGINAAKTACGLGANVYILEKSPDRLRYLSDVMPANCFCLYSSPATIRDIIIKADVVVGAVLVPGARTPTLVTRDMIKSMKKGSVFIDVAIDQGGCSETSRETTHSNPTYTIDGVVHYAVGNMAGALPRTATVALTNATLPYALEIANKGWERAMRENPEIRAGANVVKGKLTYKVVAHAFGLEYTTIDELL